MKRKRQIVSLICAAAILLGVTGCKGNSGQNTSSAADSSIVSADSSYGDGSEGEASSDVLSAEGPSSVGSTSSRKESSAAQSSKSSTPGGASSTGTSSTSKPSTGKIPTYPTVKEDVKLLNDAAAAWDFTDGGTSGTVKSALSGGAAGTHKWGVWLRDSTFGMVLDFSTEGSYFKASPNFQLGSSFTIALWVKAPIRESGKRVIMAQGSGANGWQLYLEKDNMKLSFQAAGLSGSTDSGILIKDGKWHHVMVTLTGGKLSYYLDKQLKKTCTVSGSVPKISAELYIGADSSGANGLDGSVARARIFSKPKAPGEVTSITPPNSANTMADTVLKMKKGIVLDRRQYAGPVPPENEKVYEDDVINCINMGFDHMKVLLTPNHIINSDGSLNEANMRYITRVVNDVVAKGMPCLLCIHPEVPFKQTYLTEGAEFEKVIKFYGQLAAYIGKNWRADQVALQLMTEPYDNKPEGRWSWMSDRMWGAVRNVLPDHTIVTSSDRSGNVERLKLMSPATDSNLIYSFTTYEPYTVGFSTARTRMGGYESFWDYLEDIPYPVSPTILNSSKIESVIRNVPDKWKADARKTMTAYANGTYDADTTFTNQYGGYYNADWHMKRMKSLDDWSKKYGGNIHIMCVEFGCMDTKTAKTTFQAKGSGVSNAARLQLVGDLRRAFEKYNIGWSYWSYNESFTVFLTDKRVMGLSPDPSEAATWFDYDMLQTGLGVTPKIKKQ